MASQRSAHNTWKTAWTEFFPSVKWPVSYNIKAWFVFDAEKIRKISCESTHIVDTVGRSADRIRSWVSNLLACVSQTQRSCYLNYITRLASVVWRSLARATVWYRAFLRCNNLKSWKTSSKICRVTQETPIIRFETPHAVHRACMALTR